MATAIGDLVVNLNANSRGFDRTMAGAQSTIGRFSKSSLMAGNASRAAGAGFLTLGAAAGAAAGAVVLAGNAIKAYAEFEKLQISFKVLTGSVNNATIALTDLSNLAAKTPFELPELATAAKQLLAYKFQQQELIPVLSRLGDITSGLDIPLGDLAYLFGTARVQGRLFANDINQLTNRGIPIVAELAKQFNVAESAVRDLVSSGRVNFRHLEKALVSLTSEGGAFYRMNIEQSQTLSGLWSTLQDNIGASKRGIGEDLSTALLLKPLLKGTIAATGAIEKFRKSVSDNLRFVLLHESMLPPKLDEVATVQRKVNTAITEMRDPVKAWEDYKSAIEEVNRENKSALEGLQDSAMSLRDLLNPPKTPMQTFIEQTKELNRLFDTGVITLSERNRLLLASEKKNLLDPRREATEKRNKELFGRRKEVFEATRTPLEQFRRRVNELSTLFPRGGEVFRRGIAQAQREFRSAAGEMVRPQESAPQFAAALERGSTEAFSAILAASSGRDRAKNKPEEKTAAGIGRLEKLTQQLVDEARKRKVYDIPV